MNATEYEGLTDEMTEAYESGPLSYIPLQAAIGYAENNGHELSAILVGETDLEEAWNGEWRDRTEFAENLAEDLGLIDRDARWPNTHIDWEAAAEDLFMDYFEVEAPGGGIYVFRNL